VLEEGKVKPGEALYGVIPEPSMMRIIRCHKASGGATVVVHGRAAHSSRPELGVNAILKAMDFLEEVVRLQEELNGSVHPLLGPTTIKPTLINGGFKSNIIPDRCKGNARLPANPPARRLRAPQQMVGGDRRQVRRKGR
jgi:acetylornithine deacetylase/succinyl-diaminopimelate desuccinylase-like protein